ncbi:MAG: type II secretion system F family protein [Zoogloeaceae bacterium]|jgi:general secretion pathway protein F/type IV pilus assembly protein PilC|nr:type II secretion system F family protein [Zoogloeaceae bacterium]
MSGRFYCYRLLLEDGRKKNGFTWFAVERDFSVSLWLERHYRAVVLGVYRCPDWVNGILRALEKLGASSVRREDLGSMLRDLALMLKSGISIIDGLRMIVEEAPFGMAGGTVRATRLLLGELESGVSVSQAFSRHPDLFPEIVRHLVEIGNESGTLDRMLLEASAHLERVADIGRNARRALIYPLFVFAAVLGAAAFWLYYVIPNLAGLFRQLHAKMPPLTLALIRFSDWLAANGLLSGLILAALVAAPWLLFSHSRAARQWCYRMGHRLPVSGVLLRTAGMAFFTEHLGILIRAGLDIQHSMAVLERSTGDEYYREGLAKTRTFIARGELLSVAMRAANRFPPLILRMIAVGEHTGSLDEQMERLSAEYRRRFDHLIASLAEIIKPVVILLAGAFFVFIVVALLLPVYDLIRQSMLLQVS